MILIFGSLFDEMTELVCARINKKETGYFFVNQEDLNSYRLIWNGGKKTGMVTHRKRIIKLKNVTGIYFRISGIRNTLKLSAKQFGLTKKESELIDNENLSCWMNLVNNFQGTVVNKPAHSLSNESKSYQQILISQAGFLTPKTLVTNDPKELRKFIKECGGKIIFKSGSSIRSVVTEFTKKDLPRIKFLKNCPVMFQELIEGLNIRVHIIGKKIFSTAIQTEAVDYRYAGRNKIRADYYPIKLPQNIARACIRLSETLGLEASGIDLKKTSDGKYYCFEVNPSPGIIAFERMTGQRISEHLIELLSDF